MNIFKKIWNWIKSLFKSKFTQIPIPEWPKPYKLPNVLEGNSTRFGMSNNYITITNTNKVFFDLDNDKEMDYENPQKEFKAEIDDRLYSSGDEIKLKRQSIEIELYDLPVGLHIFRVDLVEYNYIPSADTYAEHHVRAVFEINVIKR